MFFVSSLAEKIECFPLIMSAVFRVFLIVGFVSVDNVEVIHDSSLFSLPFYYLFLY